MTQKRFTLEMQYWKGNPQGKKLFDNLTGQDGMSVEELCNIASALHCKCEELKSVNEVYENSLNKLEEENKELKEVIEEVLKLLEEEVDLFSDKATEHDIQAYIELGELDNKDAYYMAISTKKAIKLLKEVEE